MEKDVTVKEIPTPWVEVVAQEIGHDSECVYMTIWGCTCDLDERIRATLTAVLPKMETTLKAQGLLEAAAAIQALHPGEIKNSVIFLCERATVIQGGQADDRTALLELLGLSELPPEAEADYKASLEKVSKP
jgi:hypothetical protein